MPSTAATITLTAGTITFANEWYVTKKVNWRVPIATLLIAGGLEGISKLNDRAGIGLSILVLIGAVTTRFNGQSVVDTITTAFSKQKPVTHVQTTSHEQKAA